MGWSTLLGVPAEPPVIMQRAEVPDALFLSLLLVQGFCWIYAYALLIHRGHVDRYLGIPVFAVVLNLTWELTFLFVLPIPRQQVPINAAWVLLDLFIIRLAFQYGRKDFPGLSAAAFKRTILLALAYSMLFQILLGWELGDNEGIYGALAINVYMSYAFIDLLRRRRSSAGQSLHIAVAKCVGTFAAGLMFFCWYPQRYLLSLLTLTVLVLDVVYIRLLHRQLRAEGASPFAINRPPGAAPTEAGEAGRALVDPVRS
jgi:hypothetical protein